MLSRDDPGDGTLGPTPTQSPKTGTPTPESRVGVTPRLIDELCELEWDMRTSTSASQDVDLIRKKFDLLLDVRDREREADYREERAALHLAAVRRRDKLAAVRDSIGIGFRAVSLIAAGAVVAGGAGLLHHSAGLSVLIRWVFGAG